MTKEEAVKMLKAKLECLTRETSGCDDNCNMHRCDDCELTYAQGNIGEQKEWMHMIIKILEQEPNEDAISRQALIERINNAEENFKAGNMESISSGDEDPYVDGVLSGVFNIRQMVAQAPPVTPVQKTGYWKWIEDWTPSTPVDPAECNYVGWVCSECEESPDEYTDWDDPDEKPTYKCCPNCGAKMQEQAIVQENATDESIEHAMASNLEFISSVAPIHKVEEKEAKEPFWQTDKWRWYGYLADLTKLPAGTTFVVVNDGGWEGKIIEKDDQKYLLCSETGKSFPITGNEDLVIDDVKLP